MGMVNFKLVGLRRRATYLVAAICLSTFGVASHAEALSGDVYYERPSSGYEGTYEWRGVMANTYVYDWTVNSTDGLHVSSVYIRHPVYTNLRHMEIGIAKDRTVQSTPFAFRQWCTSSWDPNAIQGPYKICNVSTGTNQKLLIRNMTMGVPDGVDEEWIMSLNDVIYYDQLHPLTYGQAMEAAETYHVGDDNRAYFYGSKRTSKPAAWTNWTSSRIAVDQDYTHLFLKVDETAWYNVRP